MNEQIKQAQADEAWGMATSQGALDGAETMSAEVKVRQTIRGFNLGLCGNVGVANDFPEHTVGVLGQPDPQRKWFGLFRERRRWLANIVTSINRYDGSSVLIEVYGVNNVELFNKIATELRAKFPHREVKVRLQQEEEKVEQFASDWSM